MFLGARHSSHVCFTSDSDGRADNGCLGGFPGANLHSPRREAWIYDLPSAFSSRHRQPLGIKQSDLHEDAGLVPINILVGNLAVFEADNDGYGHLNWFSCWGDARQ